MPRLISDGSYLLWACEVLNVFGRISEGGEPGTGSNDGSSAVIHLVSKSRTQACVCVPPPVAELTVCVWRLDCGLPAHCFFNYSLFLIQSKGNLKIDSEFHAIASDLVKVYLWTLASWISLAHHRIHIHKTLHPHLWCPVGRGHRDPIQRARNRSTSGQDHNVAWPYHPVIQRTECFLGDISICICMRTTLASSSCVAGTCSSTFGACDFSKTFGHKHSSSLSDVYMPDQRNPGTSSYTVVLNLQSGHLNCDVLTWCWSV